jgi:TatD DNase family protein
MIDTHCHLERREYGADLDQVIKRSKQRLQAVITSCANPKDLTFTLNLVRQHPNFIFATAGLHPVYVNRINENVLKEYFAEIKKSKDLLVGVGEIGLDYNWVKDSVLQKKQRDFFLHQITLAKELDLPVVIHSRDSTIDAIEILEDTSLEKIQMHMFTERSVLDRIISNGWSISVNTSLLRSKNLRKIVRDCPLDYLLLETDSPWLGIGEDGNIKALDEVRNEPTAIMLVARKIAEIKKISLKEVDEETSKNAQSFFGLESLM